MQNDYIKKFMPESCMAIQKKAWMTLFIFKGMIVHLQKVHYRRYFSNHLLILDGHSSRVTMQAIEQAIEFGLNMVTLPLHTSHVLQPLDVSHLKPFLKELLERLEI
jgi:hypothetical protein